MPEIEHNAPRFMYRVYWRRDIPGEQWVSNDISNWQENKLIVPDQPTFQQYRIKVVAINEKGEANVAPKEVIGYSGEDGESQCFALRAPAVLPVQMLLVHRCIHVLLFCGFALCGFPNCGVASRIKIHHSDPSQGRSIRNV